MIALPVAHLDGRDIGENLVAGKRHAVRCVIGQAMPALLRRQHQRESGIAGNLDLLDRVHLHGDIQHARLVNLFRICRPDASLARAARRRQLR